MKEWFNNKFVPAMGKLGNMRYLAAIRDGFALITPLIIIGAIAVFFRTAVFGAAGATQTSLLGLIANWTGNLKPGEWVFVDKSVIANISNFGNWMFFGIEQGTMGSISLLLSISLGFVVARSRNGDKFMGAIVGFASFNIARGLGQFGWSGQSNTYFDATGLFTAIIISIFGTELFCKLSKMEKLKIKMPEQVPPSVGRAFSALIPFAITLTVIGLINALSGFAFNGVDAAWWGENPKSFADLIFKWVNDPMKSLFADPKASLGIAIGYVFFVHFLWFFGLHGTNILNGIFGPVYIALLGDNVKFLTDGTLSENAHVFTQGTFDAYIFMGGAGVTIALVIATMLFSTRKDARDMAKLGAAPGAFNINEPIMFGYPVVLNPFLLIPFIFAPIVLTITTWLGISVFGVTATTVWIPWTSPPIIGGFLASTNLSGAILAAFNLGIAVAIYFPFVVASNIAEGKADAAKAEKDTSIKVDLTPEEKPAKELATANKAPAKKPAAKKTTTAKKPAVKKTTTAKKPAAKGGK